MKHIASLFICLLTVGFAISQDVLVPYRIGDKFGLSTIEGKMVMPAKYDRILMGRNFPIPYYGFKIGKSEGIVLNKKEIINDSNYVDFGIFERKFIIGEFNRGRGLKGNSLFSIDGKNVYPENFNYVRALDSMGISKKDPRRAKYALFYCDLMNNKKGLFAFDIDKQEISKWLLKDYIKIKIDKTPYTYFENYNNTSSYKSIKLYVRAYKDEYGKEESLYFDLENNEVVLKPTQKPTNTNTKKGNTGNGDTYGMGSNRGRNDDLAMSDEMVVPPRNEDMIEMGLNKMRNPITYNYNKFIIRRDSIFLQTRDEKYKTTIKFINLPYTYDSIKVEMCSFNYYNNDSSKYTYLENVLHFISKGKHGVLFTDSLILKPIYDELLALRTNSNNSSEKLSFLAGVKNNPQENMQYGTINMYGKPIIPFMYDSIDAGVSSFSTAKRQFVNYCNNTWKVTKNKQKGLISPNGKIILPIIYDELNNNTFGYNSYEKGRENFWRLIKNKKHGMYCPDDNRIGLLEPIFPKQIGYYLPDFRGQKGLTILGIIDDKNQPFCYARKDGFMYYKP